MNQAGETHWIVRFHHRMRTVYFASGFVGFALQMQAGNHSEVVWALLPLQFLIYPHLLFWWARRSAKPLQAEFNNLVLDALLMGVWVALLGFPIWIVFAMYIGTTLSNTVTRGWHGSLLGSGAFLMGALVTALFTGVALPPAETVGPTVLISIASVLIYVLLIANTGYVRYKLLREARQQLKIGEMALIKANEALRQQLAEVDQLHRQLSEQANRDSLTGLYNRRYLDSTLERELARCKREGRPLSLLMIDIDHFKKINDTYGHIGGDEVLKEIGKLLSSNSRAEDVPCRYGGEEFTLLLPNMPLDVARARAEHLRSTYASMAVPFGEFAIRSTLSIGIAVYPEHGKLADELTQRADHALYRAKAEGRNQVAVFDRATATGI
ncbi:MAG: diguanylate cyclase [Rhodocyclaceae bacterium]|nr:diguanylate cyclase [Rhodocyclaceae bacterium]